MPLKVTHDTGRAIVLQNNVVGSNPSDTKRLAEQDAYTHASGGPKTYEQTITLSRSTSFLKLIFFNLLFRSFRIIGSEMGILLN
jgi:hypothetical protein